MDQRAEKNNPDIDLQTSLSEAQLLLSFAARNGLPIDKKSAEAVARMRQLLKTDAIITPGAEFELWEALNTLAKMVLPVTIASLKCTCDDYGERSLLRFWDRRPISIARKAIRRFRWLSFVALIFVLLCQIYWSIGSTLITNIEELPVKMDTLRVTKKELLAKTGTTAPADTLELNKVDETMATLEQKVEMSYAMLEDWNKVWKWFLLTWVDEIHSADSRSAATVPPSTVQPDLKAQDKVWKWFSSTRGDEIPSGDPRSTAIVTPPNVQPDVKAQSRSLRSTSVMRQSARTRNSAQFALQAIQVNLLPLLYGWLGACIYVLRSLPAKILSVTYSRESGILYGLRIFLGLLAGLVVGWFFKPEANQELFRTISPFTLAFLAGYSVEMLFSFMDKLVGAFTQQPDRSQTTG